MRGCVLLHVSGRESGSSTDSEFGSDRAWKALVGGQPHCACGHYSEACSEV